MPIMFTLHESQYLKLIKYKLWAKDPHCIYCGIETILPDDCNEKGKPAPPNMATIDHKYSRLNPLRNVVKQEYLLCCNLCNNYRGQVEQDKLSIEELQRRSRKGFDRPYSKKRQRVKTIVEIDKTSIPAPPIVQPPIQTMSIKAPLVVFKKWVKKFFRPSLPFQK